MNALDDVEKILAKRLGAVEAADLRAIIQEAAEVIERERVWERDQERCFICNKDVTFVEKWQRVRILCEYDAKTTRQECKGHWLCIDCHGDGHNRRIREAAET